jgi:hypothetical protein
MPAKKLLPKFKSEDEERRFWARKKALDYFDLSTLQPAEFKNLKPSKKSDADKR